MTTANKNGNGIAKTNGNGKAAGTSTTLAVAHVKPGTEKPEEKTAETPKAQPPAPSMKGYELNDQPPLEDRVIKVQQLADLVAKHEKLTSSLKKLQSIKTSSDNRDLSIQISDHDTDWETYNSDAIKTCIETISTTLKTKIAEVEKQICF